MRTRAAALALTLAAAGLLLALAPAGCWGVSSPGVRRPTRTPTPADGGDCQDYAAALTLSATSAELQAGQLVTITATLANPGCSTLGLPQYRLYVEGRGQQAFFDPTTPGPVVHHTGVAPGETDAASFVLRAVRTGKATLTASASFEVHVGSPPAGRWETTGAGPLELTVTP